MVGEGCGFRMNVGAQVGERQLVKVLEDVISSSRKTCELSLIIAVRTSKPARNRTEWEEAERVPELPAFAALAPAGRRANLAMLCGSPTPSNSKPSWCASSLSWWLEPSG